MGVPAALTRVAPRGPASLWVALLSGPAVAGLQLSVNYALVKWACVAGGEWVLAVLVAVFLAVTLVGGALALMHLVDVGEEHAAAQTWSASSRHLLAIVALSLNGFVAIFLVNSAIGIAALSPCE
jgi:hypothetical protein